MSAVFYTTVQSSLALDTLESPDSCEMFDFMNGIQYQNENHHQQKKSQTQYMSRES